MAENPNIVHARGVNRFLGSDAPVTIKINDDWSAPSLLHAFVALASPPEKRAHILSYKTAQALLGRVRGNWKYNAYEHIKLLRRVLEMRYEQHPQDADKLRSTGIRRIFLVRDPINELLNPEGVLQYSLYLEQRRAILGLDTYRSNREDRTFCVLRSCIPENLVPHFGLVSETPDNALYKQVLDTVNAYGYWQPRSVLEHNWDYKQIVPYIVVRALDDLDGLENPRVLCYRRNGDEARLKGAWSLGIGGHMDFLDIRTSSIPDSLVSSHMTIQHAIHREMHEEYRPAMLGPFNFTGLINDDLSPVGSVHWGLVFETYARIYPSAHGPELRDVTWMRPDEIVRKRIQFETWSQLTIDLFDF